MRLKKAFFSFFRTLSLGFRRRERRAETYLLGEARRQNSSFGQKKKRACSEPLARLVTPRLLTLVRRNLYTLINWRRTCWPPAATVALLALPPLGRRLRRGSVNHSLLL